MPLDGEYSRNDLLSLKPPRPAYQPDGFANVPPPSVFSHHVLVLHVSLRGAARVTSHHADIRGSRLQV